MKRVHAITMAAAMVVGIGGCTVDAGPLPAPSASPTDTSARTMTGPDCLAPQVLSVLGFEADERDRAGSHPDAPDAGPVPEDLSPVLVVECTTGETLTDSAGQWQAVTAIRREGDLDPLLAALTPVGSPSPSVTCAPGGQRSDLWLVDSMGDAVRVAVPGAVCGRLSAAVREALDSLDAVDEEHYPVHLISPRETAG
ncbi:hypothetical protein [Cellulomonas sp. NPDC089187]|uniref:hypothetical protein n=1 Tax=Cellulomonas sp. NPDC089187 TaxID=3154970 RepID=UPI0034417B35